MAPMAPIQLATPNSIAPVAAQETSASAASSGTLFKDIFNSAVGTVENLQQDASNAVEMLLSGQNEDVHTPIIATEKADLSFQMFMSVRNKVIAAYQAVMGMQL